MTPDFSAYSDLPVLITGGAGFIGSHLAANLASHGARVTVLDDLTSGHERNIAAAREAAGTKGSIELIRGSVLDPDALSRAARANGGAKLVYHQAAMVSVPVSVAQPEQCTQINIVGTQRVLDAAREVGARRVMFAASAAAYGNEPQMPSSERLAPDSWSPYAASKIAGEVLLQAYSRSFGLSTVSLRYFNIFGPRQDPKSAYAAVISAFIDALTAGRRPVIFGDGQQTRDFTYIDNVVRANMLAGVALRDLRGEVINIGTGVRTSLLDVLTHMGRVMGVKVEPEHREPRAGDVRHSVADISRARELLGYEPVVDFATGIARTIAWARG